MIAHSVEEPFYYLYNFQQVLDWVELRYADLLDEQERAFIRTFAELPRPARALLVRMVMRKGELFRTDKLQYAEIGCTHAALTPLLDTGWVAEQVELGVEQLFGLLRKDELARCFAGQLSRPKALKHELLAELQALDLPPRTLASWFPGFPERVVQWRLQALCDRLRLLFFGNLYQDWSEFVLADLGFARYEQVAFSADSRALRSREDVTAAMALHACAEQLEQGATPQQVFAALPALAADNPWLARRRARLLFGLGQQCERLGDWEQATAIYADCQHPQARIRQIRVLERSEQWAAAHAFATQVAEAPANALEVQALERMLPRLARKLGGAPRSRRKAPAANLIHLVLPAEHATLGVERAVGQYLHQEHGGQVHYVENTLFNGLFGLLCWEVIFAPVPGAFFHPFQSAPQDLHEADFQLRRAEAFEACFARLDAGTHAEVIRQVHQAKQGLQSPFVCWPALSSDVLDQALGCLPPAHLKACFIRLLQDIRNNRTGMPDLIQFWPDEGRYRMIEVKGPGDRLQDNQLRWLEFCREHGLPVDVCHVRWDSAAPMSYTVAVRALCEFSAKVGDLDLRFTPSPTAQEGIDGHRRVVARRGAGYEAEVALEGQYQSLRVRGRADGYDPALNRLEEIKTHRGDLSRQPANHRQLHWAQAKVYGWLLCQARQLARIEVALVYLDVDSDRQTVISESWQATDLEHFFDKVCAYFLGWAQAQEQRLLARNEGLQALQFPYAAFRQGQRQLAETLYKAVSTGRCLMAQASTGIGKTLGTLFPLLKATTPQRLDKIFFLTAKTPGRALALHALRQLTEASPQPALRTLELIARDKACEHPDKACHGESCPLAQGFYDRLPAARAAASQRPLLDQAGVRDVALAHQVCPYYLAQEMARWADVVVADYNYYFDAHALLFGLAQANQWRTAVLVDEAHNLVERGRQMYSASLDQGQLATLRKRKPAGLSSVLDGLNRAWNALYKEQRAPYQASAVLPEPLLRALQRFVGVVQEQMNQAPTGIEPDLLAFYFHALQFTRVAELFDEHFLFDISVREGLGKRRLATLCLRNVVPARLLAPRMSAARSVTLFSATLGPRQFYTDLLGMPADTAWLEVAAPFRAEQLQVRIASHVSTRYRERQASLAPIVELIAEQYARQPGNYLAFFSSFEYLEQVARLLAERHPSIPRWEQAPGMDEARREAFLARFVPDGQGVGFAVLGGAFGEGVDLPGTRLIGAFVATLGLPQVNPVNEQFKQRLGRQFGAGFDYAYLYPGVRKVIQAAGRVIRGDHDQGTLVLIDERFAEARVRQMFPSWWQYPEG